MGLPAAMMKGKLERKRSGPSHLVPLSRQVIVALLKVARAKTYNIGTPDLYGKPIQNWIAGHGFPRLIQKKHAGGAEVERDRILTVDQIRVLPAVLDATHLPDSTRHAVCVVLATSVRIGESIKAKLADIDLDKAEWRIPASKGKNEDAHLIFLSRFALYHMRALVKTSPSE